MQHHLKKIVAMATLAISVGSVQADNLKALQKLDDSLQGGTYEEVTGWDFVATYQISDQGKNHTCETRWTADGWATQQVTPAQFVNATDGKEIWRTSISKSWPSTAGEKVPKNIKYVFSCTDHSAIQWINTENGWLKTYGYTLSDTVQTVPFQVRVIKYY